MALQFTVSSNLKPSFGSQEDLSPKDFKVINAPSDCNTDAASTHHSSNYPSCDESCEFKGLLQKDLRSQASKKRKLSQITNHHSDNKEKDHMISWKVRKVNPFPDPLFHSVEDAQQPQASAMEYYCELCGLVHD
ncbi:hypothetical protein FGO68_gene3301 [Halteria grandinella]|uniref:Uncharacterized protein n=1 Tax=Halteria grandinella TaxID=5974 RepID=A0A8J8SVZ1_HALGN|nr:hypothetical protein FGO68_gene3301 [Halteria grandinella]